MSRGGVGFSRTVGPADAHLIARVVLADGVREVIRRGDRRASQRGDDVSPGQARFLSGAIRDGAGHRGAGGGGPGVAGAAGVPSEEATEAATLPAAVA